MPASGLGDLLRRGLRWWPVPLGLVLLAVAVAYHRQNLAAPRPGRVAPDFTLPSLSGEPVRLAASRGRVTFVNFWATWCEPCREEMPALASFARRHRGRVAVLAVNLREPERRIRAFLAELQQGGTSLEGLVVVRDAAGRVAEGYRVRGVPETFVLDPGGRVVVHWPGPMTLEDMEAALERAAPSLVPPAALWENGAQDARRPPHPLLSPAEPG